MKFIIFVLISLFVHLSFFVLNNTNSYREIPIKISIIKQITKNKKMAKTFRKTISHNKKKQGLTDKDSSTIKTQKDGINNPYIQEILQRINDNLQNSPIKRRKVRGIVFCTIHIAENGKISITAIKSTNALLKQAVIDAIPKYYKAGRLKGNVKLRLVFN